MALDRSCQENPAACCEPPSPTAWIEMIDSRQICSFFISLVSSPLFFKSGRTTARLNADGKQPVASDLLNSAAMKVASVPLMSFTSHVGTGSSWHVVSWPNVLFHSLVITVN